MPATIDLTGRVFGRWAVIGEGARRNGQRMWQCRCACGERRDVSGANLRTGVSKSCGCYMRERAAEANTTRGHTAHGYRTPEFMTWRRMIARCENPRRPDFADYGGRGICICPAWRSSFIAFLADMGTRPSASHSIDRIDVNAGYRPTNCRWATNTQQARNRRSNRVVFYVGRHMSLAEACEVAGLRYDLVSDRLNVLGWPLERALSERPHNTRPSRKSEVRCA
jgi:hypothetical protein